MLKLKAILKTIVYFVSVVPPVIDAIKGICAGVKAGHDAARKEQEYNLAQENYEKFQDFLESSVVDADRATFLQRTTSTEVVINNNNNEEN